MANQSPLNEKDLISPNYRAIDWRRLTNLNDNSSVEWLIAVGIFYDRINGRFLAPIEAIENHPDKSIRNFCGFTVIAIDCLLIETLYQFREGKDVTPGGKAKEAFRQTLRESPYFQSEFDDDGKSDIFYEHFRCGILHQAQTKMLSKIKIGHKLSMVQSVDPSDLKKGLIINRKKFHRALKCEVVRYAEKIRQPQSADDYKLRDNFRKKMDIIVN